jgi:hypothetical protein
VVVALGGWAEEKDARGEWEEEEVRGGGDGMREGTCGREGGGGCGVQRVVGRCRGEAVGVWELEVTGCGRLRGRGGGARVGARGTVAEAMRDGNGRRVEEVVGGCGREAAREETKRREDELEGDGRGGGGGAQVVDGWQQPLFKKN